MTIFLKRLADLWDLLTQPFPSVQQPMERWRSKLLASLLTVVIAFILLTILLQLPSQQLNYLTTSEGTGALIGILVVSILVWLSRKGLYRYAFAGGSVSSNTLIFVLALQSDGIDALRLLYYPLALTLLCSPFFTTRLVALICGVQIIVMLFLTQFMHNVTFLDVLLGPIGFNLLLDMMMLIVSAAIRRLALERQTQLMESEARYRSLVDSVRDLVGVIAPTGEILSVNASVETSGWSREELIGTALKSYAHPDDTSQIDEMLSGALKQNDFPLTAVRMRNHRGDYNWLEFRAAPFIESGQATGISIVGRNINERKRADDDLRQSELRYRIVSELVSDYAFAFRVEPDGTQVYEWGTELLARITGLDWEEMQRNGKFLDYHPDDRAAVDADLREVLAGKTTSGEYRIFTLKGEIRWIHVFRRAVWDKNEQRVVRYYGVAQDITERKRYEAEQLRSAVDQERLELVNRFVHAVTHDFRTVMASIEMSRYLVQRLLSEPEREKVQPKLDTIRSGVAHLKAQMENLTTIVSLVQLKREPRNLSALVAGLEEDYRANTEQNALTFQMELCPELPPVSVDPREIETALRHLLDNAIHYTPESGTITVRTRRSQNTVCVEISDTGIGIETEYLPRIFDLFYRVDTSRPINSGGVGLGLSIAKMIAEAHAGSITVSSTPGKGSIFTLILPL